MAPRDSSNLPPASEEQAGALNRRQLIQAAGIASAAGATAAIIGRSAPAASAAPAVLRQEAQPKPGGTLNAAMQVDVLSLDPHFVSSYSSTLVIEQVYNGLIQLDENANVLPDLAESWTISDDGLIYDFKLRQGVMFHNGRALTSDDVVYSLNRIKDPNAGSPQGYLLADVATIEAPTPDSVRITMTKPFAALLIQLSSTMAIVPKEEVEKNGDLSKTAVGTGPFTFVEFIPNTHTKLAKNPNYHEEGLPYLDDLIWTPISDDPTRTANIKTSSVDFADQIPQQDIESLSNESGVVLASGPSTLHDYLMFNCAREPFSDVRVRQAIAKAIDRNLMTETILFGYGKAIDGGPIPEWSWAYADLHVYPEPDIEGAKALLAEAGYPDGLSLTIGAGSDYALQVQAAEMLKDQLKQIGVDVTPNPQEWGTYIDAVFTNRDFDAAIIGWIGAIDPDDWLYARFHTGEQYNVVGYSNPEVDRLLEEGRALVDQAERKARYNQAEQLIVTDAPYAFFYLYDQYEALRDYVKGYAHMPNNSKLTFKRTWLDK
jgi:peptide/nickel transport system substrate-binding protein